MKAFLSRLSAKLRALPAAALAFAKTRRARRFAVGLAIFMSIVGVTGIFIVPPFAKDKLEAVLSQELNRKVTIGKLSINPYALSVTIENFVMQDRDGHEPAVTFDRLYLNAEASSLPWRAVVLRRVLLEKPRIRVIRFEGQTYNYTDIIEAFLARPSEGPAPRFSVHDIEIIGGRIDFDDRPEKQQHAVTDISIGVPFVSNIPYYHEDLVEPRFEAKVNGDPVAIRGETKPFTDSMETSVSIDVDGLELPRYADYSPVPLRFKLPSGSLTTRLKVVFTRFKSGAASRLGLSGDVTLDKLALTALDGKPVLTLPALEVAIGAANLTERHVTLDRVVARNPEINVQRTKAGKISLLELVPGPQQGAASARPAEPSPPLALAIRTLKVGGGTVRLSDEGTSPAFRGTLQDIELTASDLSTAAGAAGHYELALQSDLGMQMKTTGTLALSPLAVDGEIAVTGLQLGKLYPYYASVLNLEVRKGSLDVSSHYKFAPAATDPVIQLTQAQIAIRTLQLLLPGDKELLWNAPLLEAKDAEIDVGKRSIVIGEIVAQDAAALVQRDRDGAMHFATVFKHASTPAAAPAAAAPESAPWRMLTRRFVLGNATIKYEDQSAQPPVRATVTQFAVEARELSNAGDERANVAIRGIVNRKGSFALNGTLGRQPLHADLKINVKDVGLVPFAPYLEQFANVIVTAGALTTRGRLSLDLAANAPPKASFNGDIGLNDLATLDKPTSQDLLKWASLYLSKVSVNLEPFQVSIAEIALSDFYSRLIVNPNGRLNLQELRVRGDAAAAGTPDSAPAAPAADAKPVGSAASATVPAAPAGPPPAVSIGKITLQGGNVNFTDDFVKPNYSANLTGIGGSVSEMTPDKAGDVELRGKINNAAPLEILGRVNVLAKDLFVDLKADARDIELPPLTPYAAKYAGYGIEKGKLSLNVKYLIENRKLTAENHIYLDQLTFGEKIDSPTATKLPVQLAVALLKDRNGVIDINLPISGSLDDPQFSLGGVILRVIVNLVVKAVTSPFALIGSMFGGGEELAYVEFDPGSARLNAAADTKLKTIAKALADRPGLKIEVTGRVDPNADREGLKRVALDRSVRTQKMNDLLKAGNAPRSVDDVKVDPSEYPKYLTAAYKDASFPKPRNMIGLAKDLPVPEMEQLMLTHTQVTEEDLRNLANQRAQSVKGELTDNLKVPLDRVFIVSPKLTAEGIKDKGKTTRVDFTLKQ